MFQTLILLSTLLILYQLFVRHLITYIRYKIKFGNQVKFFIYPWKGYFGLIFDSFKYYKDVNYIFKNLMKNDQNIKFVVVFSIFDTYILLIDPELVKAHTSDIKNQVRHSASLLTEGLFLQAFTQSQNYQDFTRKRGFLAEQFNFNFLKERIPNVKQIVKKNFQNLPANGQSISIENQVQKIDSEIIFYYFLGNDLEEFTVNGNHLGNELSQIINEGSYFQKTSSFYMLKAFFFGQIKAYRYFQCAEEKKIQQRLMNYNKQLMKIIDRRFDEIQQKGKQIDQNKSQIFLDLYISEYFKQQQILSQNPNHFQKHQLITKTEIIHTLNAILFTGTDTTALMISSLLYFLSKNHSIQEKVRNEINSLIKSFDDIDHVHLQKLDYLQACFKETIRIYPVLTQSLHKRYTVNKQFGDLYVPKGFIVNAQLVQYNEQKYPNFKNFDTFNPDRFLEKHQQDHFSYIPFYAGPRNCIGQHMALIQAKIMIIYLLKNYKVLEDETFQMNMTLKYLYQPLNQVRIKFEKI